MNALRMGADPYEMAARVLSEEEVKQFTEMVRIIRPGCLRSTLADTLVELGRRAEIQDMLDLAMSLLPQISPPIVEIAVVFAEFHDKVVGGIERVEELAARFSLEM
jgi:hypothetical protein